MNQIQLATAICEDVRKNDSDSITKCKEYIKKWDRQLWDKLLWRDSLFEYTHALTPSSNTLQAAGIVLCPKIIDRVIAVRAPNNMVLPTSLEAFFQTTPDQFDDTGTPMEFTPMSPVVHQFLTGTSVQFGISSASDVGKTIKVRYIDSNNNPQASTITLATLAPTVTAVLVLEGFEKDTTVGTITAYHSLNQTIVALGPTDTRAEPQQRIRLFPAPDSAITIRCLVKRKYQELTHDSEEVRLRNAENVIRAYAAGDMLARSKQFGQQLIKVQEAAALLADLAGIEYFQQANHQRLVPEVEPYGIGTMVGWRTKDYL